MSVFKNLASLATPVRPWVWGLAIAACAAAGCGFIALGCCSESHGTAVSAAKGSPDGAGMGASLDELNSALDEIVKEGKFKVNLDSQNHGDHGLMCITDRAGNLTLRILNNDAKASHGYIGTIGVTFKNKTRQTVPYYRDQAEIPGDTPKEDRAVPAGAFLAAAAQVAVAPVCCGHPARGAGMTELGTVGWNVVYGGPNGPPVCISNHHVLSNGNTPVLNHEVLLNGQSVATLYRYHPLQFCTPALTPVNYWDLALAKYNDNDNAYAGACFAHCTGAGITYPYLMAPAGTVHPFQSFHFDGYGSGCIQHYVLQAKGTGTVVLFGKNVYFDQQLLFPVTTVPRDSGALIIRDDQYVVGLHMYLVKSTTTGVQYSMANPLYRVPWTAGGIAQPAGAPAELPVFSSTAVSPDCISGAPLPE